MAKYSSQENYAARMEKKGCVRITVYVHKSKAEKVKKYARKHQSAD